MAERVNAYLTEEALEGLDVLVRGLSETLGGKVSRSMAISSILANGVADYLKGRQGAKSFEDEIRSWPQYAKAKALLAAEAEAQAEEV